MPAKLQEKDYPKIGDKFNEWIIINNIPVKDKYNRSKFEVMCSCNKNTKYEYLHQLKLGTSKMCKHCSAIRKDRTRKSPKMLTDNISFIIFSTIKRQALKRNIVFNLTPEYLQNLLEIQNFKCCLTNVDINLSKTLDKKSNRENNTASLDRINHNEGYVEGNVQWVHKKINYMKHVFNNDEFIFLCNLVSNNHANFEPSISNSKNNVDMKVQRLTTEDLETNNVDTSIQ